MHIYDKQCEIIQKNQWKGSNCQIQCFHKGTSGAPSYKRGKQGKLKRILLKFLNWYDLFMKGKYERARPQFSKYVFYIGVAMILLRVMGPQSRPKFQFFKSRDVVLEKKMRPQFSKILLQIESSWKKPTYLMPSNNFESCGRVFFFNGTSLL